MPLKAQNGYISKNLGAWPLFPPLATPMLYVQADCGNRHD